MARFHVVRLSTGRIHQETDLPDVAARTVRQLTGEGIDPEDLDIIDVQLGTSVLLRAHESAVRSFMGGPEGAPYRSFRTLAEARAAPTAALVLEGDHGGQILATCPVRLIGCSDARVHRLSVELQELCWNEPYGAGVHLEPLGPGDGVAGGMGGGIVTDGLWLHEELEQLGMRDAIEAVLAGRTEELAAPDPDVPDDIRAAIIRAYHDRVDVYCHVFGFDIPAHMYRMHIDEWRRREAAAVPPPEGRSKWYGSTLQAVVRRAGLPLGRSQG